MECSTLLQIILMAFFRSFFFFLGGGGAGGYIDLLWVVPANTGIF